MKHKKTPFLIRVKNAVISFDEYKKFSEEKISISIKYILKLMLMFTIVIAIALTCKVIKETESTIKIFNEECPEFKIDGNTLMIEEDNKQFIKGDSNGYFGILINSEKENLNDIDEALNYQRVVAMLKDKIVIKNSNDLESSITYEELNNKYDINSLNKKSILDFVTENNMTKIYALFIVVSAVYLYIIYLVQMILDILLLSVVGFLTSKIIGVKFKYKSIFNMSIYALTLSIILYMIYIFINLLTGFNVKYFEIAYNAIAYIYIITAMLTIKTDLIKQQMEVAKIIKEQKKVREEKQKEENEEDREKKEKGDKSKKEKEKKETKDDKGETEAPEGT